MSDYRETVARPSTGLIGTPAIGVRNDPGGDLAGANLALAMEQYSSDGGVRVAVTETNNTFTASVLDIPLAATPTDIFTLYGSASANVKLCYVEVAISGSAGNAAVADIQLVVRTTANSGGTSTAVTALAHDQNFATNATAVAKFYSANPASLGTSAGPLRANKIAYATPGATIGPAAVDSLIWQFGTRDGEKQPTLRGVAQGFALNLNGSTLGASSTATVTFTWREVPTTT